jgi:hypothetical protein
MMHGWYLEAVEGFPFIPQKHHWGSALLLSAAPQGFLVSRPEHEDGNGFSLPNHAAFVFLYIPPLTDKLFIALPYSLISKRTLRPFIERRGASIFQKM